MTNVPDGPKLDVRPLLHFRPDSVWLGESRMVLTHGAALGALRDELIKGLGVERARGILVRVGFTAGKCDAAMIRRQSPGKSIEELVLLGALLHGVEGLVRARVTKSSIDVKAGRFYVEGVWENSWEDEQHSPGFTGQGPACWNQIGWVSGFASELMQRLVVARETQCMSQGDSQCALVIQDAESLPDREYLRYFGSEDIESRSVLLESEVAELRSTGSLPRLGQGLLGESKAFRAAFDLLAKSAEARITVLLLGETGVGKEMFARWLHENGPRAQKPFVAVNCAAIPSELIESELFGVERGAYTGAQQPRAGRFERAHGGTLFLDEVGDLAPQAQAKLLRVLQFGEVERLGDDRVRKVDVRVVAATNVNLHQSVLEKRFRADLYYRLNTFPIEIPPLRERRADIPVLAAAFVERYSGEYGKSLSGLSDRALNALRGYEWPGNVRELENVIERAALLAEKGGQIEVAHLPLIFSEPIVLDRVLDASGRVKVTGEGSMTELCRGLLKGPVQLDELVNTLVQTAVDQAGGNMTAAARSLGITRAQIAYRLKQASGDPKEKPGRSD